MFVEMRERKPRNNEEHKPAICLRRSARFVHLNESDVENPRTPEIASRKSRVADSYSTPLGSSITKLQNKSGEIPKYGGKRGTGIKSSCRRSARLESGANLSEKEKGHDLETECVVEKRMTRSLVRGKSVNNHENGCNVKSKDLGVSGVNLCGRSAGNVEKRVTRSSTRSKVVKGRNLTSDDPGIAVVISDERKLKEDVELAKPSVSKRRGEECGVDGGSVDEKCGRKMRVGEKKKRCQVEEEGRGWTEEQQLALQRAYFTANPTPHFWKKVAKMVPGKSAEECFDRIHSDHSTPSQPRTRSTTNRKNPSPLSFSASKLLTPRAEPKSKRLRPSKRNTLRAQKTVREILQKQQNEDKDYEADYFSLLEPTTDQSPLNLQAFASPVPTQIAGFLTRCRETSSSTHKKQSSRLSGLSNSKAAAFVSPPVLKQIKNKALHEKYIDQLHCREAKRKAESLRNAKCFQGKGCKKDSELKLDSVKFAKEALVFEAQDAINQFRSLQSTVIDDTESDGDDNTRDIDEDEADDESC